MNFFKDKEKLKKAILVGAILLIPGFWLAVVIFAAAKRSKAAQSLIEKIKNKYLQLKETVISCFQHLL